MNKDLLTALHQFMARAAKATYASGGGEVAPWRKGFKELEYSEGGWYYRDSYCGFLRSWGQEVIWYNDKPVWSCSYGGGMEADSMDATLANETFTFLKKALLAGDKENKFQPRGPEDFRDADWTYHCTLKGDIAKFDGHESISQNGRTVFTHDFFGGIVVARDGV